MNITVVPGRAPERTDAWLEIQAMDAAFANPFSGEILDRVPDDIKAPLMRAPRPIATIRHRPGRVEPLP